MTRFYFDADSGWIERDGQQVMRVFKSNPAMGFPHSLSNEEVIALGKKTAALLNGETP